MKSNCIFFTTLMLAAPAAFWLQGSALAQATGGTNTPPPALENGARAGANASTSRDNVDFYFPGGDPRQFLRAVDEQYQVDWMSVADIPIEMQQVHIPAFRLSRESLARIPARGRGLRAGSGGGSRRGGGTGGFGGALGFDPTVAPAVAATAAAPDPAVLARLQAQRDPLEALVALYDSLGQAEPGIGELRVVGDLAKPSIVLFRSTSSSATKDNKMKVFSLKGIPTNEWQNLAESVDSDLRRLARDQGSTDLRHALEVVVHRDTGLLVVIGPDSMLQAAESFVTAWRDHPAPASPPQPAAPTTGQK